MQVTENQGLIHDASRIVTDNDFMICMSKSKFSLRVLSFVWVSRIEGVTDSHGSGSDVFSLFHLLLFCCGGSGSEGLAGV